MNECREKILLTQYEVINSRRASSDTMLWQAPVLSLTAQSFLFQIALQHPDKPWAVITSMILSFVVSVAALHLMFKHRFFEVRDSKNASSIEQSIEFMQNINSRKTVDGVVSSYHVWIRTLEIFGAAAIGVFVVTCQQTFAYDSHFLLPVSISVAVGFCFLRWSASQKDRIQHAINQIYDGPLEDPDAS